MTIKQHGTLCNIDHYNNQPTTRLTQLKKPACRYSSPDNPIGQNILYSVIFGHTRRPRFHRVAIILIHRLLKAFSFQAIVFRRCVSFWRFCDIIGLVRSLKRFRYLQLSSLALNRNSGPPNNVVNCRVKFLQPGSETWKWWEIQGIVDFLG